MGVEQGCAFLGGATCGIWLSPFLQICRNNDHSVPTGLPRESPPYFKMRSCLKIKDISTYSMQAGILKTKCTVISHPFVYVFCL